jgi:hypothetical protein
VKKYDPSDVLHVRGLGFDGLVGYSVVTMARESMGLTAATERYGSAYFGNGAVPQTVIMLKGTIKDGGKKLKESWNDQHQGPSKARGTHVLENGSDIKTIGVPPEDSQFLATRQFQTIEICRWFRMPPHKQMDLTRGTFSNIEHQAIEYVTDCLLSWMVAAEMEILHKLTKTEGEDDIYVEHMARGLLRGDILTRYRAHAVARQWGWSSANDVREEEGMNPIDGGDTYLSPVNMMDAEKIGEDPANPADGGGPGGVGGGTSDPTDANDAGARSAARRLPSPPKEIPIRTIVQAWRPALADVMRRALRTDIDVAKRWTKRGAPAAWAGDFVTERSSALRLMATPATLGLLDVLSAISRRSSAATVEAVIDDVVGAYAARTARDLKAATPESLPLMLEGWESRSEQDTDEAIAALCRRLTTEN